MVIAIRIISTFTKGREHTRKGQEENFWDDKNVQPIFISLGYMHLLKSWSYTLKIGALHYM